MEPICPELIDDVLHAILKFVPPEVVGWVRLTSKRALVPERLFSSLGHLTLFQHQPPRPRVANVPIQLLSEVRKVDMLEILPCEVTGYLAASAIQIKTQNVKLDASHSTINMSRLLDLCGDPVRLIVSGGDFADFLREFQTRTWPRLEELRIDQAIHRNEPKVTQTTAERVPNLKHLQLLCLCWCPWVDCGLLNRLESWTIGRCENCSHAWRKLDVSRISSDGVQEIIIELTEKQEKQLSPLALQSWQHKKVADLVISFRARPQLFHTAEEAVTLLQSKCKFPLQPSHLQQLYSYLQATVFQREGLDMRVLLLLLSDSNISHEHWHSIKNFSDVFQRITAENLRKLSESVQFWIHTLRESFRPWKLITEWMNAMVKHQLHQDCARWAIRMALQAPLGIYTDAAFVQSWLHKLMNIHDVCAVLYRVIRARFIEEFREEIRNFPVQVSRCTEKQKSKILATLEDFLRDTLPKKMEPFCCKHSNICQNLLKK